MVARYHGIDTDLGSLRRGLRPSLRGASLATLVEMASKTGLVARAIKIALGDLPTVQLPAILHWNFNHFIVLEAVKGDRFLVHDPASSTKWVDADTLSHFFTGIAVELRRVIDFESVHKPKPLRLTQLWSRLSGLKRALMQTFILSLVLQAVVVAMPYYMQLSIDRVLPIRDFHMLQMLAIGFALLTVLSVAASWLRSFVILSAGSSLNLALASNVARRLFRLPIEWFEKRRVGDILSRFQSIAPVREFLSTGVIVAVIDGLLSIVTLALILYYSVALAVLAIGAALLYIMIRYISFAFERDAIERTITTSAAEQTLLFETLRNITPLRLFNKEMARHAFWQSRLNDRINADIRLSQVRIWQENANTFLFGLENILAIYLAISFVLDGSFSVGMVFAFMAYKVQFTQRIAALVDQYVAFQMIALHLERISDIALSEEDISFRGNGLPSSELQGQIELRNVAFRYSDSDPMLFENLNLLIESGEHVAITGPSGIGKSTLLKVLLGLLEPVAGELRIDGTPITSFGYQNYHVQIAAILQDDNLLVGSLAENIALFDEEPDFNRIIEAAYLASIHDEILAMPMQYHTLVGDLGTTISGGQKQRVLLARALYRQPKILIMDEGTSHLDLANEQRVNHAVRNLGITRVIVAHRPETVRAADRVYALKDGVLIETR
jgi:ATP-binding cassette subfamily B protein RaxB